MQRCTTTATGGVQRRAHASRSSATPPPWTRSGPTSRTVTGTSCGADRPTCGAGYALSTGDRIEQRASAVTTEPVAADASRLGAFVTDAPGPSPFPPIADYGFLSDCHVNALVAPSGNVEWLCLPRPDGPSVFGAVLDRSAGGF